MFASNNASVPRSSAEYPALVGKRILVVDDEAATCVDYLFQLRERGAKAEAVVSTNAAALSFLESHPIDAAILDYRLSDGTSKPLMEWLREHQTPVRDYFRLGGDAAERGRRCANSGKAASARRIVSGVV